jgi:hypothetical protein
MPHEHLLNRVSAEYLEMPGLRVTRKQMQRLCGIDRTICQMVLDTLVETRFLYVKADRTYARFTDGEIPYPRAAKADLRPEQRFVKAS